MTINRRDFLKNSLVLSGGMILPSGYIKSVDIAINRNGIVQDVPYPELRRQLLEEGQRLDVDLDEWIPYLPEDV